MEYTFFINFTNILFMFKPVDKECLLTNDKHHNKKQLQTNGNKNKTPTLTSECLRGRKLANFFAAASIDAAAPNNSFSAITVGSSGSTQSEP
jgi:hypothetical protein